MDPILWKRMFKGIEVYNGRICADKIAVLPSHIREKIEFMGQRGEHYTVPGASII